MNERATIVDGHLICHDLGHATFGGSKAARDLNCLGNRDLLARVPRSEASEFAREGNRLHDAMQWLTDTDEDRGPDDVLGVMCDGAPFSEGQIAECIAPALDFFDEFIGDMPYHVEVTAQWPGLEDTGGTADVAAWEGKTFKQLDYKFGRGVPVFPQENASLLFYCVCIFDKFDLWDQIEHVHLAICQPRLGTYEAWITTIDRVRRFKAEYEAARAAKSTEVTPGSWCKFCDGAAICPAKRAEAERAFEWNDISDDLGEAMALADSVDEWVKNVRSTVHTALEQGGAVEGWKLVDKRAMKKWVDEPEVMRYLLDIGLDREEIAPPKLVSPAQAEKMAKQVGGVMEKGLWESVSSGTTIAPQSDKRAAVQTGPRDLSALANMTKKQGNRS